MEDLIQLSYAVDTFYFLIMGAMVMFMAPGFAMLEAGMVRSKNTSEILTKNVALFAISCVMYLLVGYAIMYGGGGMLIGAENTVDDVLASGGDVYYSARSDFFFQVVFVATAMSIISGAVAERMKLWSFLLFAVVMTGFIYPDSGSAVIETKPARAPFNAIVKSALPNMMRARISAAIKPPAAAILVFTNTWATALASSMLLSLSSDPPLKPNQPNHKMNIPSVARGMLEP